MTIADRPLADQLRRLVGEDGVITDPAELLTYECDGFPIARSVGRAVVFPRTTEHVVAIVRTLAAADVPIVPRGSGTGLTGGCVAFANGVIVCTSRMTDIIDLDLANRIACVQAGVLNTQLTRHVNRMPGGEHLHFSPDPSSQHAATIAGNAATNAGGIHVVKHGVSTQHVIGIEMVLPDGKTLTTRPGPLLDGVGPDLPALLCGSEGTLGIITRLWVRLTPKPRALRTIVGIFDATRNACQTVADVIAAGIIPAAMEMLDGAMVKVVEDAFHYGFPTDAQALLLMEIDGVDAALDEQMRHIERLCRENHARSVDSSDDPARREQLWSARKRAFGAIGRISRSYCTQDACVPRSALPDVVEQVGRIGERFGLTIPNVFHAGDGNVHPILLFDEDDPDDVANIMRASHAILEYCISVGGTITGEHGVGVEKLPMMSLLFTEPTMRTFARLKHAFDPHDRINAGKLLPSDRIHVDLLPPHKPDPRQYARRRAVNRRS